ncbi:8-oxo-dGTP diphosphatase [Oscillospiraceae bacterium HV4-5-C5C]|nr:8-oxo-dGTP diphosphatase [Oscillospiraceae bacterium HV4-5-C5C]
MGQQTVVELTNMCMITQGDKVLVQDRLDPDWRGLTFPGGHVEAGESLVESVIREVKEETGLLIRHPALCGIKQWEFDNGKRYMVLLYQTAQFSGELRGSAEGRVFWMRRADLDPAATTPDFADMLKLYSDERFSELTYKPARNGLLKCFF